jgi:protein-disulfide isomerase
MFALESKSGEIFWSSGDFPFAGAATNPTNALKITVKNGDYSARLGASGSGMPPLKLAELRRMQNARLSIWFSDGQHGWQRAGEDVPLDDLMASLDEANRRPINGAQAGAILQELHNIRSLLEQQNRGAQPAPQAVQAPPAPSFATVSLSGPSLGQSNAPLVLVEFTDFQCPFCKRFHEGVFPELVRKYVDAGKLRIVSRNLPLPFHQNAEPAAQAALCANQQEKYWPMREKLFAKSPDLTSNNIMTAAGDVSLDLARFKICWEAKTFDPAVKKDSKEADAAGITGTPSFVLGKPNGDKLSGLIIVGAQPLAEFEVEIDKLLPPVK